MDAVHANLLGHVFCISVWSQTLFVYLVSACCAHQTAMHFAIHLIAPARLLTRHVSAINSNVLSHNQVCLSLVSELQLIVDLCLLQWQVFRLPRAKCPVPDGRLLASSGTARSEHSVSG